MGENGTKFHVEIAFMLPILFVLTDTNKYKISGCTLIPTLIDSIGYLIYIDDFLTRVLG